MQNNKIVIIPTYNEKDNIEKLVNSIQRIYKKLDILFVDGNSNDGTKEILKKLTSQFLNIHTIYEEKKEGLAKAYIKGFKHVLKKDYDIILQMDADLQHNPIYIPQLLEHIKSCDIIVASRNLNIKQLFKSIPIRRKISILANQYVNIITGLGLKDTLSGFKCYKRKCIEGVSWDSIISKGFILQVEILYRIWKKNYKITEIPIIFYTRRKGQSKISIIFFMEGLIKTIRLRFRLTN